MHKESFHREPDVNTSRRYNPEIGPSGRLEGVPEGKTEGELEEFRYLITFYHVTTVVAEFLSNLPGVNHVYETVNDEAIVDVILPASQTPEEWIKRHTGADNYTLIRVKDVWKSGQKEDNHGSE